MVSLKEVYKLTGFKNITSVTKKLQGFVTLKWLKYSDLQQKLQSYKNFWKLSNLKNKYNLCISIIFLHLELPNIFVTCNKSDLNHTNSIT